MLELFKLCKHDTEKLIVAPALRTIPHFTTLGKFCPLKKLQKKHRAESMIEVQQNAKIEWSLLFLDKFFF